jgi:hypothetical protein
LVLLPLLLSKAPESRKKKSWDKQSTCPEELLPGFKQLAV